MIKLCKDLSSTNSVWRDIAYALQQFKDVLISKGSLKRWVDEIHEKLTEYIEGKTNRYSSGIRGLGFKGSSDALRTLGYFDMVPIDRNEKRFQLRTGIALRYGPSDVGLDDDRYYVKALRRFCYENLRTMIVLGENLGFSPGIVDWIIWSFSCTGYNECKGVCADTPRCNICPIKDMCFYNNLCRSR